MPTPVKAVLLLFPITPASEAAKAAQEARIAAEGQEVRSHARAFCNRLCAHCAASCAQVSPRVYFMKQTVGNACGTVGLLHAVANNAQEIPPGARCARVLRARSRRPCQPRMLTRHARAAPGSFLARFLANTAALDADARAAALAEDDSLDEAHARAAEQGQTAAPDAEDAVNLHFVAFIHADGGLYELDGRKPCAVRHGGSSADTLLADAVAVVQRDFVANAGDDVHFNVIALAPAQE